jgi:hypothetical protein
MYGMYGVLRNNLSLATPLSPNKSGPRRLSVAFVLLTMSLPPYVSIASDISLTNEVLGSYM